MGSRLRIGTSEVVARSGNSDTNPLLVSDIEDHDRPSGEPGSKESCSTSARAAPYGNSLESLALMINEFRSAPNGPKPNPKSSNLILSLPE